ncbi:MAG: DMT family transporter [Lachnospiraceae bacterium]|nr:DMT family transporter [Lachnospiraceae bacterium]
MNKQIRGSLALFLAAFIWGTAFVAQSTAADVIGPFAFSVIRNYIGVLTLIPVILVMRRVQKGKDMTIKGEFLEIFHDKKLLMGGFLCGVALCIASNLQQTGIKYVSFVGKSGFITALYIIFVPIAGLFLHKKVGKLVWIALMFAVTGLYFLCINQQFTLEYSDILLILCAVFYTVQIMFIDKYAPDVDCVALACIEFFVCGTLSLVLMCLFEHNTLEDVRQASFSLFYTGVFSSGVAYTMQMLGQKDLNPTVACLIMSLESVVSVLSGMVILREQPSGRELFGCVLMFIGVILAQLPDNLFNRKSLVED